MQEMLSLGSIFRLDSTSLIATELEMIQQQNTQCSIGYRRKIKNYEVMNSVNTRGGLKTLFNYVHNQFFKVQFYLSGNLFKDDFNSGYGVSIGATD